MDDEDTISLTRPYLRRPYIGAGHSNQVSACAGGCPGVIDLHGHPAAADIRATRQPTILNAARASRGQSSLTGCLTSRVSSRRPMTSTRGFRTIRSGGSWSDGDGNRQNHCAVVTQLAQRRTDSQVSGLPLSARGGDHGSPLCSICCRNRSVSM